jgi:hypothetical protein
VTYKNILKNIKKLIRVVVHLPMICWCSHTITYFCFVGVAA